MALAAFFVVLVVADFALADVLVALDVADFGCEAIVPPDLDIDDVPADMAPGALHLTNLPEASRHWPPLAAVGHFTNLPDASRHCWAAPAAPARLAARENAARKLSDLRMVILHGALAPFPIA